MKKVLVAMENEIIIDKLKKCGKYLVHNYDIDTKESVIDYLHEFQIVLMHVLARARYLIKTEVCQVEGRANQLNR